MSTATALALTELLAARVLARGHEPIALPAAVAMDDLPTPCLVLDLDQLSANITGMQARLDSRGLQLRPHTKMHKCPEVARRQLAAGAVGLCCAKVAEAEVMACLDAPLLVTSPVATPLAAARLAALAARVQMMVVADASSGISQLAAAATAAGVELGVLIDVDPSLGRTGAQPEQVPGLVREVLAAPGLRFCGLQAYAGQVQHIADFAERDQASRTAWAPALALAAQLRQDGISVARVSGGGTGTWDSDSMLHQNGAGVSELQAGSYAFMDQEYGVLGARNGTLFDEFPVALTLLSTCISSPRPPGVTLDAGIKAFATDSVLPEAVHPAGLRYRFGGDEHGIISRHNNADLQPGSRLRFVVPHCDPTVNLHDVLFPVHQGEVTELWPVTARGCGW